VRCGFRSQGQDKMCVVFRLIRHCYRSFQFESTLGKIWHHFGKETRCKIPVYSAQFSGCSSKTCAHSETGQITVCSQNLTLGALSSRSALSLLVGALFKKFGLFLNTPCTWYIIFTYKQLFIRADGRTPAHNVNTSCLRKKVN
jgi:hypothetical protein